MGEYLVPDRLKVQQYLNFLDTVLLGLFEDRILAVSKGCSFAMTELENTMQISGSG
jgi:hypothetical protein